MPHHRKEVYSLPYTNAFSNNETNSANAFSFVSTYSHAQLVGLEEFQCLIEGWATMMSEHFSPLTHERTLHCTESPINSAGWTVYVGLQVALLLTLLAVIPLLAAELSHIRRRWWKSILTSLPLTAYRKSTQQEVLLWTSTISLA